MLCQDHPTVLVVQRERTNEGDHPADDGLGLCAVVLTVELVVFGDESDLAPVDAPLRAVQIRKVGVCTDRGSLEQSGNDAADRRHVSDRHTSRGDRGRAVHLQGVNELDTGSDSRRRPSSASAHSRVHRAGGGERAQVRELVATRLHRGTRDRRRAPGRLWSWTTFGQASRVAPIGWQSSAVYATDPWPTMPDSLLCDSSTGSPACTRASILVPGAG